MTVTNRWRRRSQLIATSYRLFHDASTRSECIIFASACRKVVARLRIYALSCRFNFSIRVLSHGRRKIHRLTYPPAYNRGANIPLHRGGYLSRDIYSTLSPRKTTRRTTIMGFDAVGVASRVHVFSGDSVDGDGGCGGGLVTRNKGTYTFLPLSRRLLFE